MDSTLSGQSKEEGAVDYAALADFIVGGALKEAVGIEEVRAYCLRILDEWGCKPPTNQLLLLCCARAGTPVVKFALAAAGTNLVAFLQSHPRVARLFSRLARICAEAREREQLKDHLLAELRGEQSEAPAVDVSSQLAVIQSVYLAKKLDGLDDRLEQIVAGLQAAIETELGKLRSDPVEILMDRWQNGRQNQIAERVRYNSGCYRFQGREGELALLRSFLGDPVVWHERDALRWLLLTGAGGTGKTRLAMEFVRHHLPEGWVGRRLPINELGTMKDWAPDWLPRAPTLIVIDYPAQRPEDVRDLLGRFQRRAPAFDFPLRLLLLERDPDDRWFDTVFPKNGDDVSLSDHTFSFDGRQFKNGLRIKPPGWENINAIVEERLRAAACPLSDPVPLLRFMAGVDPQPPISLQDGDQIPGPPRPLFVLATIEWALAALGEGADPDVLFDDAASREEVLKDILERDRKNFWAHAARAENAALDLHENLLALAGFALGLAEPRLVPSQAAKFGLASFFPDRPSDELLDSLSELSAGRLVELQPDLLGEYHVLQRLAHIRDKTGGEGALRDFCALAYQVGAMQSGAFALRCERDFPQLVEALNWLAPAACGDDATVAPFAAFCTDFSAGKSIDQVSKALDQLEGVTANCRDVTTAVQYHAQALVNLARGISEAQAWDKLPGLYARLDGLAGRFGTSEAIGIREAQALFNVARGIAEARVWDELPGLYARLDGLAGRFGTIEAIGIDEAKALKNLAIGIGEARAWDELPELYARLDGLAGRFGTIEAIGIEEAQTLVNLASGIGEAQAWDEVPGLYARLDGLAGRFGTIEAIGIEEAQTLVNLVASTNIAHSTAWLERVAERWRALYVRVQDWDEPSAMLRGRLAVFWLAVVHNSFASGRDLPVGDLPAAAQACLAAIILAEEIGEPDYARISMRAVRSLRDAFPQHDVVAEVVRSVTEDHGIDLDAFEPIRRG